MNKHHHAMGSWPSPPATGHVLSPCTVLLNTTFFLFEACTPLAYQLRRATVGTRSSPHGSNHNLRFRFRSFLHSSFSLFPTHERTGTCSISNLPALSRVVFHPPVMGWSVSKALHWNQGILVHEEDDGERSLIMMMKAVPSKDGEVDVVLTDEDYVLDHAFVSLSAVSLALVAPLVLTFLLCKPRKFPSYLVLSFLLCSLGLPLFSLFNLFFGFVPVTRLINLWIH